MSADCDSCSYQLSVQDEKIPTECTLSHGKPCLACERQVKLRKRIEETKRPLDELITAECKAQTDVSAKLPQGIEETKKLLDQLIIEEREARSVVNASHDPLQSRLPVEIVTYIFRLTLPPFTLQEPSELVYFGLPLEKIYCSREALILGAVCRAWRQTAWSTPKLWNQIMLTLHRQPTQNKMDVVKEWLERSSPSLLKIRLFLIDHYSSAELNIPGCSLADFASLFNEHSDRWEVLSIQSSSSVSDCFQGNAQGAARLTDLQVLNFSGDIGHFQLKGGKPKPSRIDVAGYLRMNYLSISWENITVAELDDFYMNDYFKLLWNVPQLVRLKLTTVKFADSNRPYPKPPSPPIQHDLRNLYFDVGHEYKDAHECAALYSVIFDGVTYPSLRIFTFDGPESVSFNKIKQCLERSSPPLIVFQLSTRCDQQEALDLLYSLPSSLQFLKLDLQNRDKTDFDLDTVFDHFICAPTVTDGAPPRPELLPNLFTFEWFIGWRHPHYIPWSRIPYLCRPLSGRPERPLDHIRFILRTDSSPIDRLYFLDKCRKDIDETAVRGLIGLMDDGVDIFLPGLVSREDLLAVLESNQ